MCCNIKWFRLRSPASLFLPLRYLLDVARKGGAQLIPHISISVRRKVLEHELRETFHAGALAEPWRVLYGEPDSSPSLNIKSFILLR